MSRRTAEASKAIRLAWEREQNLVLQGKGTRDWTIQQQKDILDPEKGRAYDENGRALEGQHMKSAEEFPEYQGNPDNIQFLTREEHLEAHKGCWKNPTNWYYDPVSREYIEFAENELIPCKSVDLRKPVCVLNCGVASHIETKKNDQSDTLPQTAGKKQAFRKASEETSPPLYVEKKGAKDFLRKIRTGWSDFAVKHPKMARGLQISAGFLASVGVSSIASKHIGKNGSGSDSVSSESGRGTTKNEYPDERSSPRSHNVSGYNRQQNGRTVHVKPYNRGGKKNG
ncbi:MAG: hypothetical protein IK020_11140 [Clostridiales bacterium]|nr:hypothetical protein [Clostridiales bacterium]